jgi:hypothetical protein
MHANDPAARAACRQRAADDYELDIAACRELPEIEPEPVPEPAPEPDPSWPEHAWELFKSAVRTVVDGVKRAWRTITEFVRDNWMTLLLLLLAIIAVVLVLWFLAWLIPYLLSVLAFA